MAHWLYRCFNRHGTLLYVGITSCGTARFSQHKRETPWWPDVATRTVEAFPSRPALEQAEREAVAAERPLYNRMFSSGQGVAPPSRAEALRRVDPTAWTLVEPPVERDAGWWDVRLDHAHFGPFEMYSVEASTADETARIAMREAVVWATKERRCALLLLGPRVVPLPERSGPVPDALPDLVA